VGQRQSARRQCNANAAAFNADPSGSTSSAAHGAQELWGIDDVANYLGVPKQTIYSWRTTGYGPQGFRVGKHVRWRAATVIAWTLGLEQGN